MSSVSVRDLVGCKFCIHGRSKDIGFDCWGVAIEVYKRLGIVLPDPFYENLGTREEVYNELMSTIKTEKIEKPVNNCIIVFNERGNPHHVGVYLGDGLFIHSTHDMGVTVEPLYKWKLKVRGYYKVSNS